MSAGIARKPTKTSASSDEIQWLFDAGDAVSAYQTGVKNTEEYAGDPQIDFIFGLAAIDTRHPEQTVFAFCLGHCDGGARIFLSGT